MHLYCLYPSRRSTQPIRQSRPGALSAPTAAFPCRFPLIFTFLIDRFQFYFNLICTQKESEHGKQRDELDEIDGYLS